jgi:hypothetical protein
MLVKTTSLLVVGGALLVGHAAAADPDSVGYNGYEEPNDFSYGWHDERLPTGIGVGFSLGGGLTGFTDQSVRNNLQNNVQGLWDARMSIGTHVPLGIDISYVGTASSLANPVQSGGSNGTLVGTAVEAALRWNILPHFAWDPYIFAGAGWQNYEVTGQSLAMPGMRSSDNSIEFPMGVGMAFRDTSGWLVDVRGTFRADPDSNLILTSNNNFAEMHSWEASAALGYEF